VRSGDGEDGETTTAFLRSAAERRLKLREVEDLYIDEIMKLTNGNKVHASKLLGVDRKTLYRRMERKVHSHGGNGESEAEHAANV